MAWVGTSAGKLSAAGSSLVCEAVTSEGWSVSTDGSDSSSEAMHVRGPKLLRLRATCARAHETLQVSTREALIALGVHMRLSLAYCSQLGGAECSVDLYA